jgi:UDP-N-acetylmuramate--alanine ligase
MLMKKKFRKIHFVGIGGIGMSGIAEVLINQGFIVTGSDRNLSEITDNLERIGAVVHRGHNPENVGDANVLVYSSAVTEENPEVQEAKKRKIPVIRRAEMLGELMRMKYGVAVAGTHGKTTTSSLVGHVLDEGGFDPTLIIGGRIRSLNTNARLGTSNYLVAEADEYDRSFLTLTPTVAAITNIETDHLDCYADLDDIKRTFAEFANKVPFYGSVVACLNSENVLDILPLINKPIVTYGFSTQADYQAADLSFKGNETTFSVFHGGEKITDILIHIPGEHNVLNALAAFTIGRELDIPVGKIRAGLEKFTGVIRRFEIKYQDTEIIVVDDYAHHPTEVRATLKAAASAWHKRVVALFQPHLYSRTRDFYKEFGKSFVDADVLVVTDIYPAREEPIDGVSGEMIAEAARAVGHKEVYYVPEIADVPAFLEEITKAGDVVVGLGAGDVWRAVNAFIEMRKEGK